MAAPRRALHTAEHTSQEGKAAGDVAVLLALAVAAIYTLEITKALSIGAFEGIGVAINLLVGVVSEALSLKLMVLFAGSVTLSVAAGRKRAFGRDFDLACVALMPFIGVELLSTLILRTSDWLGASPGRPFHLTVAVVAYGWTAYMLVLAWLQTRQRRASGRGEEEVR